MKKRDDYPYPECAECKTLADCKNVDRGDGEGFETKMPPNDCPFPMRILRHTLHKKKLDRNKKYHDL